MRKGARQKLSVIDSGYEIITIMERSVAGCFRLFFRWFFFFKVLVNFNLMERNFPSRDIFLYTPKAEFSLGYTLELSDPVMHVKKK